MIIKEHNVETGEVIEIEMTAEQIAIQEEMAKQFSDNYKAVQDRKAALYEKLGITEEEAKLLLS